MNPSEARYRVISTLLQAGGPLALEQLLEQCDAPRQMVRPVLADLVAEGHVVEGELLPDRPAPQYCWAARWAAEAQRRSITARRDLDAAVALAREAQDHGLAIDSKPILAWNDFVLHEYTPPQDKRLLVFLQCSVRRPFSTSPSHGSMRRAIAVATGYWPREDFEQCPVHVVVLASRIGPVPYELEDVYPANIRGGGVKHFAPDHYERVKPILAERMAAYITAHRAGYDHMATFTQSRYGEVMRLAREIAGVDFPVLPVDDGPIVSALGDSTPRTYWQKYWIQLALEIMSWLPPAQQKQAVARMRTLKVKYTPTPPRKRR